MLRWTWFPVALLALTLVGGWLSPVPATSAWQASDDVTRHDVPDEVVQLLPADAELIEARTVKLAGTELEYWAILYSAPRRS